MNFLDLEFLATGSEHYRYPLEKNGHGRKQGLRIQEGIYADTFEGAVFRDSILSNAVFGQQRPVDLARDLFAQEHLQFGEPLRLVGEGSNVSQLKFQ